MFDKEFWENVAWHMLLGGTMGFAFASAVALVSSIIMLIVTCVE